MNKEQQELLDEVYKAFEKWYNEHSCKEDYTGYFVPDKEEFIRLIKTDDLFSEKWGLKIEERELSLEERWKFYYKKELDINRKHPEWDSFEDNAIKNLNSLGVPAKAITVTRNDKKLESYG
jgi:hypothetical protein